MKGGIVNKFYMTNDNKDFDMMCLFALRYTFGRMTYSAFLISDFIKSNIEEISYNVVDVMIRDIEDAIKDHEIGVLKVGMDCDLETYKDLLEFLRKREEWINSM